MSRTSQVALSSWIIQYLLYLLITEKFPGLQYFHNNFVPWVRTQTPPPSYRSYPEPPSSTLHQEPHSQRTTPIPWSQEGGERSTVFFPAPTTLTQHTLKILAEVITADEPWFIDQAQLHQNHTKVYLNSCIVPGEGADCNPAWHKNVICKWHPLSIDYWQPPYLRDKGPDKDILYSIPSWLSRHPLAVTEAWVHVSTKCGCLSLEPIKVGNFMEMTSSPHPQHPTASAA